MLYFLTRIPNSLKAPSRFSSTHSPSSILESASKDKGQGVRVHLLKVQFLFLGADLHRSAEHLKSFRRNS